MVFKTHDLNSKALLPIEARTPIHPWIQCLIFHQKPDDVDIFLNQLLAEVPDFGMPGSVSDGCHHLNSFTRFYKVMDEGVKELLFIKSK